MGSRQSLTRPMTLMILPGDTCSSRTARISVNLGGSEGGGCGWAARAALLWKGIVDDRSITQLQVSTETREQRTRCEMGSPHWRCELEKGTKSERATRCLIDRMARLVPAGVAGRVGCRCYRTVSCTGRFQVDGGTRGQQSAGACKSVRNRQTRASACAIGGAT